MNTIRKAFLNYTDKIYQSDHTAQKLNDTPYKRRAMSFLNHEKKKKNPVHRSQTR